MGELRVMTLNVGSLFEPDWATRRHEVVAWIDQVAPDVICLQEIHQSASTANTGEWIANTAAAEWHHCFGGHPFGGTDADPTLLFGSSILSRQPIDHHELHRLPTVPDPDSPMAALVPWELLHARTGGLDVFSTHLAPAPSHGRHRKLQVLTIDRLVRNARGDKDRFAGTALTDVPPILCGDFNAEPDSDEIRFLCGLTDLEATTTFWQDAWRVAGDGGPGYTQNWRTNKLAASLNVHRKRIDYIFVGDPFMRAGSVGRVLDARVIADDALTTVKASDHWGLVATIVAPD